MDQWVKVLLHVYHHTEDTIVSHQKFHKELEYHCVSLTLHTCFTKVTQNVINNTHDYDVFIILYYNHESYHYYHWLILSNAQIRQGTGHSSYMYHLKKNIKLFTDYYELNLLSLALEMYQTCHLSLHSFDAEDGIYRLIGSILCLLMPWLLKLPGHQQAWYWLCRTRQYVESLQSEFHLFVLNQI